MTKKRRRIKRRLRVDRILILLLILGIIGFGLYFGITHLFKSDDTDNSSSKPSVKEEDKTYELSLVMVGDNLIHDSIYKEANGCFCLEMHPSSTIFSIRAMSSSASLIF